MKPESVSLFCKAWADCPRVETLLRRGFSDHFFSMALTSPVSKGARWLDQASLPWISSRIAKSGVHEPGMIRALYALKCLTGNHIKTFFDVGLLHGYCSLVATQILDLDFVVGFEMNPPQANLASVNFFLNRHVCQMLHVVSAGVSSSSDFSVPCWYKGFSLRIRVDDPLECNALASKGYSKADLRIISLDDYCAVSGIVPDLIKIDVEGSQASIIKGSRSTLLRHRPVLLIETDQPTASNHEGTRMADIFMALSQEYGYTLLFCNHRDWDSEINLVPAIALEASSLLETNALVICLP